MESVTTVSDAVKGNMRKWSGRVALVTGASHGIGMAITRALVEAGMRVVGVARNLDNLEKVAEGFKNEGLPGVMVCFKCDIGELESVRTLFKSIRGDPDLEGVDVVINNAAQAYGESFLDGDMSAWKSMMDTNFFGAAYITQEAVRSMKERGVDDGHIVYMNSLAGRRIIPGNKALHFYATTKAALRFLLEGVRIELREKSSGIRVSAVSPGVVDTELLTKVFENDEDKSRAFFEDRKYLQAENIADAVVYILSQPSYVQVHDIMVRATEQLP